MTFFKKIIYDGRKKWFFFKCTTPFCKDNFAKSKVISKCKNDKPFRSPHTQGGHLNPPPLLKKEGDLNYGL